MAQSSENLQGYLEAVARFRRGNGNPPKGYHYTCTEDYVLDRGCLFSSAPLTEEEKKLLSKVIGSKKRRFPVKACFYNAQMLTLDDDTGTIQYCEGLAFPGRPVPIYHAWNIIHGKVIDLTWRTGKKSREHLGNRVIGGIPEGWAYYGAAFNQKTVRRSCLQSGFAQALLDDWMDKFPFFKQKRKDQHERI